MNAKHLWERYQKYSCFVASIPIGLDVSRMGFDDAFLAEMTPAMHRAFDDMAKLEQGAVANPDEERRVGHYWLRAPELAPSEEVAESIRAGLAEVKGFAARVHSAELAPPQGARFTQVLLIGIGGSALGPMFVADALGHAGQDPMRAHFIDNTDPEGIKRVLDGLAGHLAETLCVVTSKSGGTPETRNGMLLAAEAYRRAGLDFARHAVAITLPGSKMDQFAESEKWLARFPMFDWVGGRTSETSVVGLLPAALQGLDVDALLTGAAACDVATRQRDLIKNPAALLALMWHQATGGQGEKDMVVLPYKDRLLLFGRYLQQLIMESLGKRLDLKGKIVNQGLSVYGNKGSTDQHAYVQQLRDGIDNFFVLFIRVLESGGPDLEVEPGVYAGDYLNGFLMGTRSALFEGGRASMTLSIQRVEARTVGALIALFERAVGFYASLIGINAYHQPGVEAGKRAAAAILNLQTGVLACLDDKPKTALQIAGEICQSEAFLVRGEKPAPATLAEDVHLLLEHLEANHRAELVSRGSAARATFRARRSR